MTPVLFVLACVVTSMETMGYLDTNSAYSDSMPAEMTSFTHLRDLAPVGAPSPVRTPDPSLGFTFFLLQVVHTVATNIT